MLKEKVESLIKSWDPSGCVGIYHEGHVLYDDCFGYSDRENGIKIKPHDTYLVSRRSRFIQAILLMHCTENYGVSLDDYMVKYLKEYPGESSITLRHLLFHESGLPDYFYGHLMVTKSKDDNDGSLNAEERYVKESQWFYETVTFKEVLEIVKDRVIFEAGSKDYWSATNEVFLEEVIERVMKMPIQKAIEDVIFKPLGLKDTVFTPKASTVSYVCMRDIHLLRAPYVGDEALVFTTSKEDIVMLMKGLSERKLLSASSWKEGLIPNKRGEAILCSYRNGMEYYSTSVLGYDLVMYIDKAFNIQLYHVSNEGLTFRLIEGNWMHFQAQLREVIEAMFTYPKKPYLELYNERNAWDTMQLKLAEDQKEFVIDVKTTLCWAYSEPDEKKVYVLMEGYRAIGMMMLAIDPKKHIYAIDILIVDERYQKRGYGKIMLEEGLKILKEAGAKKFDIIVNRFNKPAYRLYIGLGFKETDIYEVGVRLSKPL